MIHLVQLSPTKRSEKKVADIFL